MSARVVRYTKPRRFHCPMCDKPITVFGPMHRLRIHGPRDTPCDGSEMPAMSNWEARR